jgi:hypothetical protein
MIMEICGFRAAAQARADSSNGHKNTIGPKRVEGEHVLVSVLELLIILYSALPS